MKISREAHKVEMVARKARRAALGPSNIIPGKRSKYMPHQGKREKARRVRQMQKAA